MSLQKQLTADVGKWLGFIFAAIVAMVTYLICVTTVLWWFKENQKYRGTLFLEAEPAHEELYVPWSTYFILHVNVVSGAWE